MFCVTFLDEDALASSTETLPTLYMYTYESKSVAA